MSTIIFIHGTGVRGLSYIQTYQIVEEAVAHYCIGHKIDTCRWGDQIGSKLPTLSLPDRKPKKKAAAIEATEEQEFARWQLLYNDPIFELRLLKNRPPTPAESPNRPDLELWERIARYTPSKALQDCLLHHRLGKYWSPTWDAIIVEDPTARVVLHSSPNDIGEPAQAIARALVATMTILAITDHVPIVDGARRDEMVDIMVSDWEATVAGIGAFLTGIIADVAETLATPLVRRRREVLSQSASPAAGDILLYQARGESIRAYIRNRIHDVVKENGGDVILLAHSLGGIACVDLLIQSPLPEVRKLITAGTQASLLYEINALWSLEKGKPLPERFPHWLNLYDPNDFLSYVVAPVFGRETIYDYRIESGQPFPEAHSAYWSARETWQLIRDFINDDWPKS